VKTGGGPVNNVNYADKDILLNHSPDSAALFTSFSLVHSAVNK